MYRLPFYDDRDCFDDPPDGVWRFTAQDYTLAYALDVDSNCEAEELVRAALDASRPDVVARVTFTSERGCFFAHTDSLADMEVLVSVVAEMVNAAHPAAVTGSLLDSPAAVRPWDRMMPR